MTIYYRVTIQEGIKTEEQKTGFYSGHEELGVTVFKSLRAAKQKFNDLTIGEIQRIKAMRLTVRAMKTRDELQKAEAVEA